MSADHGPSGGGALWREVDRGLLFLIGGALALIAIGLVSITLTARSAPELSPATTPEGTVQRFYQAAYQGDYAAAYRLLSTDVQRRLSERELQDRMGPQLRQSQIRVGVATVQGNRATVPVKQTYFRDGLFGTGETGSEYEMSLERDGDAWKITGLPWYLQ